MATRAKAPALLRTSWQRSARRAAHTDGAVGIFLSGGLDSAATAAWCGRKDAIAFTGRFLPEHGPFDESEDAVSDLLKQYVEMEHSAKGAWAASQKPFRHPCKDSRLELKTEH